jgi:BTB/POZ domain/MATH domain
LSGFVQEIFFLLCERWWTTTATTTTTTTTTTLLSDRKSTYDDHHQTATATATTTATTTVDPTLTLFVSGVSLVAFRRSVAPPKILSPVATLRFRLNDVAGRSARRGQAIILPSELAHGYHWTLGIYVRGSNSSSTDREHFSIYLILTDPDVTVEAEFSIKAASKTKSICHTFSTKLETPRPGRGWPDFIAREALLSAVPSVLLQQDGSLTIDVDLRVNLTKPVWYPTPPSGDSAKTLLADLVRSSLSTDVTFMVDNVEFCLHRHVLAKRAPALLDMIDGPTGQRVPLDDVDSGIFQSIVLYMYTGDWSLSSSDETVADAVLAKNTLTLADRYGCTGLKLLVESVMVDQVLNASNAAEMLLLGDSLHCALLKEAAITEILECKDAVRSLPGWELLVESNALVEDLLDKARGMKRDETAATAGLSVGELRDQLLKHGAAVDGSREVLVHQLLAITADDTAAVVV